MGTTCGNSCSENDGNPLAVPLALRVHYFQTNPQYVLFVACLHEFTFILDLRFHQSKNSLLHLARLGLKEYLGRHRCQRERLDQT